jgi:hypothetical protein
MMENTKKLKRAKTLEMPTASGWWYCVGQFNIRMCYVNMDRDVYSFVGAEVPDQSRRVSIQNGVTWLAMTEREAEAMTAKHGTLHLA